VSRTTEGIKCAPRESAGLINRTRKKRSRKRRVPRSQRSWNGQNKEQVASLDENVGAGKTSKVTGKKKQCLKYKGERMRPPARHRRLSLNPAECERKNSKKKGSKEKEERPTSARNFAGGANSGRNIEISKKKKDVVPAENERCVILTKRKNPGESGKSSNEKKRRPIIRKALPPPVGGNPSKA